MENTEKRWLTVDQTAEYLNLKPKSIYNKVSRKSKMEFPVKARRFGGKILFDRKEIDQYLEAQ